jgi:hypothetical protein
MTQDPPRNLPERTGRHRCIRCLAETPAEEYLRNDHLCDACSAEGDYPPPPERPKKGMRDEG